MLSLIHTFYNSLQHVYNLLYSLNLHRLSPGNGFKRRSFLNFRRLSHNSLLGWRPSHTNLLRFSLSYKDSPLITSKSKSKLCYDRRSVGQSVLVSSTHLGPTTRFLLVRQLRVCWCGAPSLTRERVCRLQLLLVLASAVILGSESRRTRDHILLSQIRHSPNLEGQVPVFISPRNRVAQLYSQAPDFRFVASYESQSYGGGITTDGSVGQSVLE
jgi:hypothetical protein